jgi:hypothetical protein
MWIKDPKSGEPSVTLTAFSLGFAVSLLKMLGSGIQVGPVTLSQFGGGDFAAAVGAVGAIYWARRNAGNTDDKSGPNG